MHGAFLQVYYIYTNDCMEEEEVTGFCSEEVKRAFRRGKGVHGGTEDYEVGVCCKQKKEEVVM